jgi:putative MATE family efflux protein
MHISQPTHAEHLAIATGIRSRVAPTTTQIAQRRVRAVVRERSIAPSSVAPRSVPLPDRELRGRVWNLALPAIGEQLLALGVGVSDTFLAGHLSSAAIDHLGYSRVTAIAAVSVATTAVWVVLTAFFAINIGVTALVARATGANDKALASRAAGQGILLGIIAGLGMIALAVPLASLITHVLGVSGQVASLGASYIRIFSLALPATGAASAATAAMRGAGDARRPLAVMLIVNGMNVIGSWTLMNGLAPLHIPPIGVIGSACGAASGWLSGALLALFFLSRRHSRAPLLTRRALRFDRALAARILRVGLPSAAELVVFQIGIVSFGRIVVSLGQASYAANTTMNTVESMGTLPGFGFSVATTALVGQALGASDPELARRVVLAALRPCVLIMATVGLIAALFPQFVLGLFVADPTVLRAGATAMRFSAFTLPASATAFIFIGALRGAGDTKFPVVVRALGTWGIRVPLALAIIPVAALPGARIAMALDFCTQAGITYWRFRSGRWQKSRV